MYQSPKVIRLRGKSTVEEIAIVASDMPNMYVEALTVANGKIHHAVREIAVPPESRVVDIGIEPSLTKYRPGEKAKIKLKLTQSISGPDGSQPVPFVGSTVVAVYDKAIEYISAGFYFPGIRDFFWNWRRFHSACTRLEFRSVVCQ